MTPYYLAFPEGFVGAPYFIDLAVNCIFTVDVISNFLTAYYDDDYQIIDNVRVNQFPIC